MESQTNHYALQKNVTMLMQINLHNLVIVTKYLIIIFGGQILSLLASLDAKGTYSLLAKGNLISLLASLYAKDPYPLARQGNVIRFLCGLYT